MYRINKWILLCVNVIHEAKGFSPLATANFFLTKTFRKIVFSFLVYSNTGLTCIVVISLTAIYLNTYVKYERRKFLEIRSVLKQLVSSKQTVLEQEFLTFCLSFIIKVLGN